MAIIMILYVILLLLFAVVSLAVVGYLLLTSRKGWHFLRVFFAKMLPVACGLLLVVGVTYLSESSGSLSPSVSQSQEEESAFVAGSALPVTVAEGGSFSGRPRPVSPTKKVAGPDHQVPAMSVQDASVQAGVGNSQMNHGVFVLFLLPGLLLFLGLIALAYKYSNHPAVVITIVLLLGFGLVMGYQQSREGLRRAELQEERLQAKAVAELQAADAKYPSEQNRANTKAAASPGPASAVESDASVLDYRGDDPTEESQDNRSEETPSVRYRAFFSSDDPGKVVSSLPSWTRQPALHDGNIHRYLLKSGRYATIAEANQELLGKLTPLLREYLIQRGTPPLESPIEIKELLASGVVSKRLLAESKLTIGDDTFPMYQMTWEVALQPGLEHQLAFAWKPIVQRQRLIGLGLVLGTVILLIMTWAGYFRIDTATDGRYRRQLQVAAIALSLLPPTILSLIG